MTSSSSWILVGAVGIISVLGQLSLGRNTILASLRAERFKAYSDFLASVNKGVRMAEDIVVLSEDAHRASNEVLELKEEFVRTNADFAKSKVKVTKLKSNLDPVKHAKLIPELNKKLDQHEKEYAMHQKKIAKIESENIPRTVEISRLKIQVEGFLTEMDRALVLMQLASPAHLVKLGESLRSGIDLRRMAAISREDLEARHRDFISVAKRDLRHPIWTKIRGKFC